MSTIASEHKGDGPEKKITRLAIGVEGGFDPESGKNKFEFEESYAVVILPNFITLPWPDSEFPEIIQLIGGVAHRSYRKSPQARRAAKHKGYHQGLKGLTTTKATGGPLESATFKMASA
uniref:Uncharacterized protein n=1 Tax=Timema douglasi TaxID=61478 RepID=A0A7R8VNZ3_TIMDO|nr:unnamed protein product [Timema douglasi]